MRTMSATSRLITVAALILLGGCVAGTNFSRPPVDTIQLGETTYGEVVQRFGKPISEERVRRNEHLLRVIKYFYSNGEEAARAPATRGVRRMEFLFSDDIVVGEGYVSTFASDHTDFDESKVKAIIENKTTCAQIVSMLGRPSARIGYPLTQSPGETVIAYMFAYAKGSAFQSETFEKSLTVGCDQSGIATRVKYSEEGDR
jgi:hypothetical protein